MVTSCSQMYTGNSAELIGSCLYIFTGILTFLSQGQRSYPHIFGDHTPSLTEGLTTPLPFSLATASVMNFLKHHHAYVSSVLWTDTSTGCCSDGNMDAYIFTCFTMSVQFDLCRFRQENVGQISTPVLKCV